MLEINENRLNHAKLKLTKNIHFLIERGLGYITIKMGKISAQPHTIVKQICFPNGNVLFLSLFSLSKNWMHNVVWGCAEILPLKVWFINCISYVYIFNCTNPRSCSDCHLCRHLEQWSMVHVIQAGTFSNLLQYHCPLRNGTWEFSCSKIKWRPGGVVINFPILPANEAKLPSLNCLKQ